MSDLIALCIIVAIWGGLAMLLAWIIGKVARRWSRGRRLIVGGVGAVGLLVLLAGLWVMAPQSQAPVSAPPQVSVSPNGSVSSGNASGLGSSAPSVARSLPRLSSGPSGLPTFPWPPPAPSASIVIPRSVVLRPWQDATLARELSEALYVPAELVLTTMASGDVRLAHVDAVLRLSLSYGGYRQASYYAVPSGFALVARLERINEDGSSYPDAQRWDTAFEPMNEFSLASYLRALFLAPPGYFRVIAFIVSSQPFTVSSTSISADEANAWLELGANALPIDLANQPFGSQSVCTALIYEFEKRDAGSNPLDRRPGRLAADIHIAKSKIGEALRWQFP
jgi:hypothetical protein